MKCYYCGEELKEGAYYCTHCNRDQRRYFDILKRSDELYNDGLAKARVKDISGAIVSLNNSLKENKRNIEARNLLGLCYYERGQYVDAVTEWVISKNLEDYNPAADRFLDEMKRPGEMDRADKEAEKYNRALDFARNGEYDMAKLLLKKNLSQDSHDILSFRLLILLYINDNNYQEAIRLIKRAQAIDINDTYILRYKNEIREKQKSKKKKKKRSELVNFSDGNDSIVMTRGAFRDFTGGSRSAVFNIITGIILGVLFCYFLVIPSIRQNAANSAANSIVQSNANATSSKNSVSQLKEEVSSLKEELKKYDSKSDTVTSYEQLLQAKTAIDSGDMTSASTLMQTINKVLLSEQGQALYQTISDSINADALKNNTDAARQAYSSGDYQTAVNDFLTVIGMQENYEDGQVLYDLAESYYKLEDYANAVKYYNRVNELYPDSSLGKRAMRASERASKKAEDAQTAVQQ
jgi:tetratricopeptide (TPR) repeat protein